MQDLYVAHLALSDIDGKHYYHTQRVNRAGPGLAGASLEQSRVWNGNWQATIHGDTQQLQAITEQFSLQLDLVTHKPPVIHGKEGVSQKVRGAGTRVALHLVHPAADQRHGRAERQELPGQRHARGWTTSTSPTSSSPTRRAGTG